jgi:hypothetical protein
MLSSPNRKITAAKSRIKELQKSQNRMREMVSQHHLIKRHTAALATPQQAAQSCAPLHIQTSKHKN